MKNTTLSLVASWVKYKYVQIYRWNTNMFNTSCSMVSNTFFVMGFIAKSTLLYKFHSGFCYESYYRECLRQLAVRNDEHIGISLSANKRVQLGKNIF